jgi:hypothetical protein
MRLRSSTLSNSLKLPRAGIILEFESLSNTLLATRSSFSEISTLKKTPNAFA